MGSGGCVELSLGGSARDTAGGGRKSLAGVRGAAEGAGVLGVEWLLLQPCVETLRCVLSLGAWVVVVAYTLYAVVVDCVRWESG